MTLDSQYNKAHKTKDKYMQYRVDEAKKERAHNEKKNEERNKKK